MPYWTRGTLGERLVQLVEDLQLAADRCIALDTAAGGSVGLPEGEWGTWRNVGAALAHPNLNPPSHKERMQAHLERLPRADDSDLGALRSDVEWAYLDLHSLIPMVDPWLSHSGDVRIAAVGLRQRLALAEDEAHRVLSGAGDLRRNERRARH